MTDSFTPVDKMLVWERLTNGKVEFASDLVCSLLHIGLVNMLGNKLGNMLGILKKRT